MDNAPFSEGQKLVSLASGRIIKKGDIVTVAYQFQLPCCKQWFIGCLEHPVSYDDMACDCNDTYFHSGCFYVGGAARFFAPIETQYIDCTKEIAESITQTDEVPDKILIPETVNN